MMQKTNHYVPWQHRISQKLFREEERKRKIKQEEKDKKKKGRKEIGSRQ